MSESPLELAEILKQIDTRSLTTWDDLDDVQKKEVKKSFYTLTRYISTTRSNDIELQARLVLAVNEYYNKHWNALQSHPGLLWRLLCICSPGTQIHMHDWMGFKKTKKSPVAKFLSSIYPSMKMDEVELLARITSVDDLKTLASDHGYTNKQIKAIFK